MDDSLESERWKNLNRFQLGERLRPLLDQEDGTLHVATSGSHHVVVTKEANHVCLWLHDEANQSTGVIQSELDLVNPLSLVDAYTRAALLALLWTPAPARVFTTGLGGGCLPMAMHHHLADAFIQCVENDPQVADAATRFFGFLPADRLRLAIDDGRRWLEKNAWHKHFDIIILDVFDDKGDVPHPLSTLEFFQLCQSSLSDHGVLVINLLYLDLHRAARIKTAAAVFEHVYLCPMDDDNDVLFASRKPLPSKAIYIERMIRLKEHYRFGFPLVRLALKLKPVDVGEIPEWSATKLLTDSQKAG
jgi:spermidine synthase